MAEVLRRLRDRRRDRGTGDEPRPRGPACAGRRAHRERLRLWDAEPLLARLAEAGIPAGKVRTLDEVYAWEQTKSQGLLVDVQHATLGTVTLPGPPLRFFTGDGKEVTRLDHAAPPTLDEHGDDIRAWLQEDA